MGRGRGEPHCTNSGVFSIRVIRLGFRFESLSFVESGELVLGRNSSRRACLLSLYHGLLDSCNMQPARDGEVNWRLYKLILL